MKLTKTKLKQLIKEELRNILSEQEQSVTEEEYDTFHGKGAAAMAQAAHSKKTSEEDRLADKRMGMPCTNTGFGPPGSPKWMRCMEQVLGSVLSVVGPNA